MLCSLVLMFKPHASASCYCSRDNIKKEVCISCMTEHNWQRVLIKFLAGDHTMCDVKQLCKKIVFLIMIYHFLVGSWEMMNYSSVHLMEFEDVYLLSCTNRNCKAFSFWNFHQVLCHIQKQHVKSKQSEFYSIHHRRWTFYFPSKRAKCMKSNRIIVFLLKYSNILKIIFNHLKIPCPHWSQVDHRIREKSIELILYFVIPAL